jgi:anthranilate phosphoribosyltransferase
MEHLGRLLSGGMLDQQGSLDLFTSLLTGGLDAAQIGAVLGVLSCRGVGVHELVGAAQAMRAHVTPVPFVPTAEERLVDTCGTGGALKTFNVSTAAALVAAAADPAVKVAKHGNRSRTGRGSAEVLAWLGVNIDAGPEIQARCLRECGVCFCFAIHHHPAMRHAAGPRRSLGVPTVLNLLGPLTNPAGARRQLIGVYEPRLVPLMARALARLGAERALVVHSREGLDEIGLAEPTDAAMVQEGEVVRTVIRPWEHGLSRTPRADLLAQGVEEAGRMIRGVVEGRSGGARDIVLINAAAALWAAGRTRAIGDGVAWAARAIDSGRAAEVRDALVRVSRLGLVTGG